MAALYPEDFQGAAPGGVDIICLSSDEEEEMGDQSMNSVLDLHMSSDDGEMDDEIMMMAQCVEMQLSSPIPIPGPSTALRIRDEAPQYNLPRYGASGTSFAVRPTLDQSFFSLGKGNGPIRWDDRVRNNHPIKLCREIIRMVDTPMSPPPGERTNLRFLFGGRSEQNLPTVLGHGCKTFSRNGNWDEQPNGELLRLCDMWKIYLTNSERSSYGLFAQDGHFGRIGRSARGTQKSFYGRNAGGHFPITTRGSVAGCRLRWQHLHNWPYEANRPTRDTPIIKLKLSNV